MTTPDYDALARGMYGVMPDIAPAIAAALRAAHADGRAEWKVHVRRLEEALQTAHAAGRAEVEPTVSKAYNFGFEQGHADGRAVGAAFREAVVGENARLRAALERIASDEPYITETCPNELPPGALERANRAQIDRIIARAALAGGGAEGESEAVRLRAALRGLLDAALEEVSEGTSTALEVAIPAARAALAGKPLPTHTNDP